MLGLFRTLIHLGCSLPLMWLTWALVSGDESAFGADPSKELIHFLGYNAIVIFCVMFLLGIFLQWRQLNQYQILRRALGLWVFSYAVLHVSAFLWLELALDVRLFGQELIKRPYLILGSVAFLILAMMAITSLPSLKQKLGKRWFSLHQWSYIALAAAAIHYYWSVKSLTIAPIVVGCVTLFILAVRLIKNK